MDLTGLDERSRIGLGHFTILDFIGWKGCGSLRLEKVRLPVNERIRDLTCLNRIILVRESIFCIVDRFVFMFL